MRKLLLAAAALALVGITPVSAADSALGRISYIYPDGHRLILDSQTEFRLSPAVNSNRIGVAEFVRLGLGRDGMVTSISPGPPALAGYWVPRPGGLT